MFLYIKTTLDKYELPIAVADSPRELAKMLGTSASCVSSSLTHKRSGWYKIRVEEDETRDKL